MGTWTIIKLCVGAAIILGLMGIGGKIVYDHDKKVKAALQAQIDNLKLEQDILIKRQKTIDDYLVKKGAIKKRVTHEEQQVDQTVDSGDVNRVLDMFHGLRQPNQAIPPADGRKGRAKPAPR